MKFNSVNSVIEHGRKKFIPNKFKSGGIREWWSREPLYFRYRIREIIYKKIAK